MNKIIKKFTAILLTIVLMSSVFVTGSSMLSMTTLAADYTSDSLYFHDQGGIYMSPLEPTSNDEVTIRLRTPKDVPQSVQLYTTDLNGSALNNYTMSKATSVGNSEFDYYEYILPATSQRYRYYFRIKESIISYKYYSALGVSSSRPSNVQHFFSVWPNFSTPDWSKGAYYYSLVPSSFYNGNTLNDVTGDINDLVNGNDVAPSRHRASFGGDLAGIIQKLSYIKDLGCTAVYMNPIWPSYDSVGYGVNNTYMIDPQYGTEEELSSLVDKLHNNDMQIMMDVLVHSVSDYNMWYNAYNMYPNVGAVQSQESPYYDLFHFNEWPSDPTKFLASIALDYNNELTRKLMYEDSDSYLKRYLAEPYNVDAYRFDAGAYLYGTDMTLNEITGTITSELKASYPDKLLVCENYTDDNNSYDHLNNGWDSAWNTPMIYAIRNFAEGNSTITTLKKNASAHLRGWPRSMALSMYVPLTTHDFVRLQNTADDAGMRTARLFQMTFLGSPSLYYGDEIDAKDYYKDSTECFDWNEDNWNKDTYSFVKALGDLRKEYSALKDGVVKYGDIDDSNDFMSFSRWDETGTVVTLINNTQSAQSRTVNVKQFDVMDGAVLTDYFTGEQYTVSNGSITLNVVSGGTVLVSGAANSEYLLSVGENTTLNNDKEYFDDFTSALNSDEFTAEGNYTIVDNNFKTSSDKTTYLTDAPINDWTIKTVLTSTLNSGEYAGLAATGGNNDGIFAGRLNKNGTNKIVLARISNGVITIYDEASDSSPDTELTIQLQRTGNYFTASYKYSDQYLWQTFDGRAFGVYSSEKIGLYSTGDAEFSFVTLGNKIDGGTSLCTPINKNADINVDFAEGRKAMDMVSWSTNGGTWDYTVGGLSKTDNTEGYFVASNIFGDFRSEVTVSAPNGTSKTGIVFGGEATPSTSKGYYLALNNAGLLTLYKDGTTTLATANVSFDTNNRVKLILERVKDRIVVYAGADMTPVISVTDDTYQSGKFALTSNGTAYFGNYTVFSVDDNWTEISDTYIKGGRIDYHKNSVILKGSSGIDVAISRKGAGYTDVYAGVELTVNTTSADGISGIALMGKEGISPFESGIVVGVQNNNSIVVLNNGEMVSTTNYAVKDNKVVLAVVHKNGAIKVYADDLLTPVITYNCAVNGGTVSLVSRNVDTAFSGFSVEDITEQDIFASAAFYETALKSKKTNLINSSAVTTTSEYVTTSNNVYSHEINNMSVAISTDYAEFANSSVTAGQRTEITGVLNSGSSTISGTNSVYNSPVITFRKVNNGTSEGYLKIRMTKNSGGMALMFGNDYLANGTYVEFFDYGNGVTERNDNIDNTFRILSDGKTVSVWINGVLVLDNYDYSATYTDVAPAAVVAFHQYYGTVSEFTWNEVPDNIFTLTDSVSLTVNDTSAVAGDTVTITKDAKVKSGTFNAIYCEDSKIKRLEILRTGFRDDKDAVNEYSITVPDTDSPILITAVLREENKADIAALGAQYKSNGFTASIRFGTHFGYDVQNGKFTVNGVEYKLQDSGTLISSVTALGAVDALDDELMRLDSAQLWGDKASNLINVKRTKYYDYCNEYIEFAATIVNIPLGKYNKVYAARGYVVGIDDSGNTKAFYTDIMYRSVNDLK